MRLWLSKNSEVPLREQLVAQVKLGIVSNDLKAFVITDSKMVEVIPPGCSLRVFSIISDESAAELRDYVELFFK